MTAPVAFARDGAIGRLVGVALPDEEDAIGLEALVAALGPEEQAFARGLPPARRATWAGGRVALRAALAQLGIAAPEIPPTPRGAPALPAGVVGSISHKPTLAVALAARSEGPGAATLGLDLELDRAPRVDISARVLTVAERARLDALPSPAARVRELMLSFAAKEALYKALDPWLARFISFQDVELSRGADGTPRASFAPRAGEPSFTLELAEEPVAGFLVVAARCRVR
jgi:enterobactin synthetase component D